MSDNGILAQIPGEHVAAALQLLPCPRTDQEHEHQVVIDAGHAGWVRIFFERKQARHHKHSHFYWSAYRAEAVAAK